MDKIDRQTDKPSRAIDKQIEDSFPASDPPSYSSGGRVGEPKRNDERKPTNQHKGR